MLQQLPVNESTTPDAFPKKKKKIVASSHHLTGHGSKVVHIVKRMLHAASDF
jgi:hypothetical protein